MRVSKLSRTGNIGFIFFFSNISLALILVLNGLSEITFGYENEECSFVCPLKIDLFSSLFMHRTHFRSLWQILDYNYLLGTKLYLTIGAVMKRINNLSRAKILMILNKVPFFNDFTSFERERIVDNKATFYVANEDEYIIEQGTLDTAFYILMSGSARVSLEGQEDQVLAEMGPGDFFGEIAFLENSARSSNVIANNVCIMLKVDRRLLGALTPEIREKFKDQIIHKLVGMVTRQNDSKK